MGTKKVSLSILETNPVQLPQRTLPGRLGSLKKSIFQSGLLEPILITSDFIIIDGHRRVACCRELGFTEIDCNILNGQLEETNVSDLFLICNSERRNFQFLMYINAFLKGDATAIPVRILKNILFIVEKINRKFLKYLLEKEVSPLFISQIAHPRWVEYNIEGVIPFEFFCKWIIENKLIRVFRTGKIENLQSSKRKRTRIVEFIKRDWENGQKVTMIDLNALYGYKH